MQYQEITMAADHASQQIVDLCLALYHWELLEREEFVRRVRGRLAIGAAVVPRQAVFEIYILALYSACSGAEGRARQERGYIELYAFLVSHAARRYPEVHLDATQRALETIYRTFEHCRRPEAFLAFALQKLRDAGQTEIRMARRNQALYLAGEGDDTATALLDLAAPDADPLEHVTATDFRSRLMLCVRVFLRRHPRATQQLAVLWMKHIEGLDDRAIGERLGKSTATVHVLRSRAIAKLREDPDWQMLACEIGLNSVCTIAEPAC
jgi:RNA polymerase sigma factor (sigma-70 family)